MTPPTQSQPLHAHLRRHAREKPDAAALVWYGRAISWRDLDDWSDALGAHLQSLGVGKGAPVALFMNNCPQYLVAHYAIQKIGAIVCPCGPLNKAHELEYQLGDLQARVIIAADNLLPIVDQVRAQTALQHVLAVRYGDLLPTEPTLPVPPELQAASAPLPAGVADMLQISQQGAQSGRRPTPVSIGMDDIALMTYTSGTTGLPKGCMHTHASIMHNAVACALWSVATAETVGLVVVPMFHITGMVAVMHASVYAGATMILMPRWDRELAGRLISRWKVTNFTNIPTMIIDLLASPNFASFDLTSLKTISGGGAAMPQAVAQRLFDAYGLRYAEGYGLTETAAPSHQNPVDHTKQQCLGIPFMSTDARVVDPETLKEVPQGEQGEIVIHGPEVFQGYWKRPEATEAAFFELDGKRFFRSGDLGRVDEDGYFFITDRLKRMINASGFKVWPAEVEALMFRHPAIQEACIIAAKDSYRGETVKAVVVLRATHKDTTEQQIIDWCRENMAVYKVPRIVQFVPALPKSGSGKVMWRALQESELAAEAKA